MYWLTRYKSTYFNCKFLRVVWQAGKTSSGAWLLHLILKKEKEKKVNFWTETPLTTCRLFEFYCCDLKMMSWRHGNVRHLYFVQRSTANHWSKKIPLVVIKVILHTSEFMKNKNTEQTPKFTWNILNWISTSTYVPFHFNLLKLQHFVTIKLVFFIAQISLKYQQSPPPAHKIQTTSYIMHAAMHTALLHDLIVATILFN